MNFADAQQKADYLTTLRKLRVIASHWQLQDTYADDLTLEELGERVAELRNIEQTLVSIYQEREEAARAVADTEPVPPPRWHVQGWYFDGSCTTSRSFASWEAAERHAATMRVDRFFQEVRITQVGGGA